MRLFAFTNMGIASLTFFIKIYIFNTQMLNVIVYCFKEKPLSLMKSEGKINGTVATPREYQNVTPHL